MLRSFLPSLLLAGLSLVSAQLPGYITECATDTAIAFDDGPYIYETELADELVSIGANATFFINGYNWVGILYNSQLNIKSKSNKLSTGLHIRRGSS